VPVLISVTAAAPIILNFISVTFDVMVTKAIIGKAGSFTAPTDIRLSYTDLCSKVMVNLLTPDAVCTLHNFTSFVGDVFFHQNMGICYDTTTQGIGMFVLSSANSGAVLTTSSTALKIMLSCYRLIEKA